MKNLQIREDKVYNIHTTKSRVSTSGKYEIYRQPIEIILLAATLLRDKLGERVFNIKEYHTIVAVDRAYSGEPKILWAILVISERIRQGGGCISVAGVR